ncbi:MAG: hypothetical protein SGARI_004145 [Bacillariaceae sp.]
MMNHHYSEEAKTPPRTATNGNDDDDNGKAAAILANAFQMIRVVNLKECDDRWRAFRERLQHRVKCQEFVEQVKRFDAVNGKKMLAASGDGLLHSDGGGDETRFEGIVSLHTIAMFTHP